MSSPQPFVVPAGVTFQITDAGVVIENEGDIVLHTNFGRSFTRIVSTAGSVTVHAAVAGGVIHAAGSVSVEGNVQLIELVAGAAVSIAGNADVGALRAGGDIAVHGSAAGGQVAAGGDLTIAGDATLGVVTAGGAASLGGAVKADAVRAQTVRFGGASVSVRGVQGAVSVHVGGAKLQVDAIIAPEVHLDAATSGRVTVIESHNDLAPNAIKGGFRLADYAEMFGDPAPFLADRGLVVLGAALAAPVAAAAAARAPAVEAAPVGAAPVGAPAAAPVEAAAAPSPPVEPSAVEPSAVEPSAVEPSAAPVEAAPDPSMPAQAVAEAEPASVDDIDIDAAPSEGGAPAEAGGLAPIGDPVEVEPDGAADIEGSVGEPSVPEHPLHRQLLEAVTRIAESYADAELPPAVSHLMGLITGRAYDQVRAEITSIWSDLLKYHQKKGLRIQHQVTTTFNTINSLVKKM